MFVSNALNILFLFVVDVCNL